MDISMRNNSDFDEYLRLLLKTSMLIQERRIEKLHIDELSSLLNIISRNYKDFVVDALKRFMIIETFKDIEDRLEGITKSIRTFDIVMPNKIRIITHEKDDIILTTRHFEEIVSKHMNIDKSNDEFVVALLYCSIHYPDSLFLYDAKLKLDAGLLS